MGERQRFTREALYDLVWKELPSQLARRFGLSDVGFAKTCRRLEVPLPARGYWRRRQVGQRVERPKLPPLRGAGSWWAELMVLSDEEVRAAAEAAEAAERDGATATADPVEAIAVPAGLDGLSKPGERTHARLSRAKPDERGVVSARGKGVYAISVSPAQVGRATRIMDALVVACASRDMKVSLNPDGKRETALTVDGERFGLYLEERVRRREKDLTPAEQRARAKHPYRWHGKQHEYLPTGELSLRILDAPYGSRCQWRDGKRQRLENCLGRVVQALTALAQVRKSQRAEREARERAWATRRLVRLIRIRSRVLRALGQQASR